MKYRKIIVVFLTTCFVFGNILSATAENFTDMPNNWSTTALKYAVEQGYLSGMDGKLMPNGNLTKAQLASILNRVTGNAEKADISGYRDVSKTAWYYDDMAKAVAAGLFQESGEKLEPQKFVTRQEAFSAIARAYHLPRGSRSTLTQFVDSSEISNWATEEIAALVEAGIITGSNQKLSPNSQITRAEFAVILYNLTKKEIGIENMIGTVLDKAGTYTQVKEGNITISTANVELKNVTVTGNLILNEQIGKSDVKLTNVVVEGKTIIYGGGGNAIYITGSKLGEITVENKQNTVTLSLKDTDVESLAAYTDVIVNGSVKKIVSNASSIQIRGDVLTVLIQNKSDVMITSGTIKEVVLSKDAKTSQVNVDSLATVESIEINGSDIRVYGTGTLRKVDANANDIVVITKNTMVKAGANTLGVLAGNKAVKAGKSMSTGTPEIN